MKLVSWNVNGIRAILKKDFLTSVKDIGPDVLCLQETKAQKAEVEKALAGLPEYHLYTNSAVKKGYSSTAILSKKEPLNVTNDMGVEEHDQEGRVQCAEYDDFYLVNVYVPNSGQGLKRLDYRQKWDKDFRKYLTDLQEKKPVIVCGDFNVAHQAIDLKNDKSNYNKTSGYTQVEIDGMTALQNAGFIDTFRKLHPDKEAYSYWSYRFNARARNTGWRIDYFLVSERLMEKVVRSEILPDYLGSDHCPVELKLDL
jgi:exodeoxyribonuclease-3